MKALSRFLLILSFALSFQSCIKDEPRNSECDILCAWVEGATYEPLFYQQSQMRQNNLPSTSNEIVFVVRSTSSLPMIPVFFDITPGATITPANGTPQDFSSGAVTYTVTSEDRQWTRTYSVKFREAHISSSFFSFEHVDSVQSSGGSVYHIFYEEDSTGDRHNIWASGNAGVDLVQRNWTSNQFPTHSVNDGYRGKGLCLRTQYSGDLGAMIGKPIASGTLFLGNFDLYSVLTNPLQATQFGIPINKEPVQVTGWYKYRPGEQFTDASMNVIPDRVDEASIYAVLYRNHDAYGNSVTLDGSNVLTSEYIVSKAQVATLPATDEWTRFEMSFEGSAVDPIVLSSMGYNFTLVFSSSKNGDAFQGAIGSTLYVDEVEVEFRN